MAIDDVFEMPLELTSRPVFVDNLFNYVQRHQTNMTVYQSEFAVRRRRASLRLCSNINTSLGLSLFLKLCFVSFSGGLAYLVTSFVTSTKLLNAKSG